MMLLGSTSGGGLLRGIVLGGVGALAAGVADIGEGQRRAFGQRQDMEPGHGARTWKLGGFRTLAWDRWKGGPCS